MCSMVLRSFRFLLHKILLDDIHREISEKTTALNFHYIFIFLFTVGPKSPFFLNGTPLFAYSWLQKKRELSE
jgi:hypothetical protein